MGKLMALCAKIQCLESVLLDAEELPRAIRVLAEKANLHHFRIMVTENGEFILELTTSVHEGPDHPLVVLTEAGIIKRGLRRR